MPSQESEDQWERPVLETDWSELETEHDESENNDLVIENELLAKVFHWGVILLLLTIVFFLAGGLFWIVLNFKGGEFLRAKTEFAGWGQFATGGFLGVAGIVLIYFEPLRKMRR